MEILINYTIGAFLLPPGVNIVAFVLAWGLYRRAPRSAGMLACASLLSLLLLSMPVVSDALSGSLNRYPVVTDQGLRGAQAIVVLGGGRISAAAEYANRDIPAKRTVLRLQYAATLQRHSGLPVAVTGGTVPGDTARGSEADLMHWALTQFYRIPVRWVEGRSRNTAENARYTYALLAPEGIKRIVLVTEMVHMPRSVRVFQGVGFTVVAAPTILNGEIPLRGVRMFLPVAQALTQSSEALHEWIGMAWYALRY